MVIIYSTSKEFLDDTISVDRIRLIHLNDSAEGIGSHLDRHTKLGEGVIGLENLKRFVMHPKLKPINVLTEPPAVSEEEMKIELQKIIDWNK